MDHAPADCITSGHLCGVEKTLRRIFAPATQPSDAIAHALEILAAREMRQQARTGQTASVA